MLRRFREVLCTQNTISFSYNKLYADTFSCIPFTHDATFCTAPSQTGTFGLIIQVAAVPLILVSSSVISSAGVCTGPTYCDNKSDHTPPQSVAFPLPSYNYYKQVAIVALTNTESTISCAAEDFSQETGTLSFVLTQAHV